MGVIIELPVVLGQAVRADEILVKLHATEANARVTQARSQLSIIRRDLERERDLQAKGASTAETVRNLQDRLTASEALVRETEAQLGYAEVRAPFDGVVSRRFANHGDLAVPGHPLVEVEETNRFEVEAGIPDSLVAALKPGTPLACQAGDMKFTGTLAEISSSADTATRTISVKITVPAGTSVRSGQFARVDIPGTPVRALLVPTSAVSLQGQMERIFLVGEGSRAALRLVRTGATRGDRVEILSGLNAGDRIILSPDAALRDGQPLEVQP
jgi:RND family efflux transporter MFP subunit